MILRLKEHITPRYYQNDGIAAAMQNLRESPNNKPIIVLPTGAGKALVTVMLSIMAVNAGRRILHITHSKELVSQNAQAFIDSVEGGELLDVGICSAGLGSYDLNHQVVYAGIQTIANRIDGCVKVDLLVSDECHRIGVDDDSQYKKVIDYLLLINPKMRIIGLSATPFRQSQGLLTWATKGKKNEKGEYEIVQPLFNKICYEAKTGDLIKEGYLSEIVSVGSAIQADLNGVKKQGGDYSNKELGDKFEVIIPSACAEIIEVVKRERRGKIIVFASTVANAEHIAELLPNCRLITGNSSDRDDTLEWFAEPIDYNKPKFLCNIQVLTTGFNQVDIDCIAMLFATVSSGKYIQVVGRGLRKAASKDKCIILDYGTNIFRLGSVDNPIVKQAGDGEAPTKICVENKHGKGCEELNWISAESCTSCGQLFEIKGGDDKYTTLSTASALLESQVKNDPVYLVVESVFWDIHEKQGKPASLKVSFYDDSSAALIIKYFPLNSAKGFALSELRIFFKREADFYKLQNVGFFNKPIQEIAEKFNTKGASFLKKIVGFTYIMNGKFKEIEAYDFED
jgi:DNA repair protein RadD